MERAHRVVDRSELDPDAVALHLRLDLEARRKRRHVARARDGTEVLVDLAEVPLLRDGDGLDLGDGRLVVVEAEAELLTAVTAENAAHLLRLAWHLGNRHLPVQIADDRLLVRRDAVVEAMLVGLGARCDAVEAPFEPESGAYGRGDHHAHG